MLLLTTTTDKLQVITGSAVTVDVHASYVDYVAADASVVPGKLNSAITTATTTDIVAVPGSGITRNVKTLHIANKHASSSNLVTVQYNQNATLFELEKVTLLAGERLEYVEGRGFRLVDANGMDKIATTPSAVVQTYRLASTQSNSTTTATEVTGLSAGTGIGTWVFEYFLRFQSATSTVGPKLSVNYDGTVTSFIYDVMFLTAAALDSSGVMDQAATAPQVMGGMADRAKATSGLLIVTAGVDTINVDILVLIKGLAEVTVAGNFELWHGSETATSTSIMAGSALRLTKAG